MHVEIVHGIGYRLVVCVSAVASHIELHLWINIEVLAIGPECTLCGSGVELVDPSVPWNNFSPCLALIICPVHGWKNECNFET